MSWLDYQMYLSYSKESLLTWLFYFLNINITLIVLLFCFLLKGNAQFVFLCNPQKSGASRVCITFLQITKKVLTKDIIHWLELIFEILSFLQIFSVRKITTQLIWYFRKSARKSTNNYISDIFWTFKSQLQTILVATYVHCIFLTLINPFLYV